jgi:hypothetical protein
MVGESMPHGERAGVSQRLFGQIAFPMLPPTW